MVKALRKSTRVAGLVLALALASFLSPAAAADGASEAPAEESADAEQKVRDPSDLTPKELAAAIKGLDRDDGAVRYARAMQRDGAIFLAAGGAVAGVTLGVAAIEGLREQAGFGPYVASIGVPLGMGLLIVGVPQVVLSTRLLGEYALNGPAPTAMSRLKVLRRWRIQSLRWMRDGAFLGAALTGFAGVFSAVTWAVRDSQGLNGTVGDPDLYRPLDGTTAVAFLGTAGGLAASGLVWTLELREELVTPHRLFAMPTLSVGPDPAAGEAAVRVSAGLVVAF